MVEKYVICDLIKNNSDADMTMDESKDKPLQIHGFDDALDLTGFGKYNIGMLVTCCLLILAMYLDMFGFSVVLPPAACDLALSASEQGLLSAVPLIGVMISSYAWGLCADTMGRRATLLIAMPIGGVLNLLASIAPTFSSLAALKFLSACFTSSANAAAFVLLGESVPRRQRSRFMFLMASATMLSQLFISIFAIPVFRLTFRVKISWLFLEYRPWRLLMQIICLPGVISVIAVMFLHESPKFLLSKNRHADALEVLRSIYHSNTGLQKKSYPVTTVFVDETLPTVNKNVKSTFLRKMWDQTAPLFKPPLLKNSLIIYYILLCAYMTSTGFTVWIPTMTNVYFNGDDHSGKTFCEVASKAAVSNTATTVNCDNIVPTLTLYAVMCYSGMAATVNVLLSFIVGLLGKKRTTLMVFTISAICGALLIFVQIPLLSIALFYMFLYVAIILGNANTYLVELNPTHLRGMATCLSVVVARGFSFISVQLIAWLLADHCVPMVSGYVVLVTSGLIIAILLPPDAKREETYHINTDYEKREEKPV